MVEQEQLNEVTETVANNLTDSERKIKIEQLSSYATQIESGISDPHNIIHEMVFSSEKVIFDKWASTLKQLHYLGAYPNPINTISKYIKRHIGNMNFSLDKKENLYRNVSRSLASEYKEPHELEGQNVSKNTSAFLTPDDSFLLHALAVFISYHKQMASSAEVLFKHCQDPQINADFSAVTEWEEFAFFCSTLESMITPIMAISECAQILDRQLAEHSTVKNIEEQFNIRQSVDTFRNAMRILGILDGSFRNWAHKFGISPRQHQRVRERDKDWPEKDAGTAIKQVLASYLCPHCKFDIVNNTQYVDIDLTSDEFFLTYRFREKNYKIPDRLKAKGLNPIQIAEKVFGKTLKLVPME
jgi:hypothetical protein